jgi:hypothetical protein
MATKTVTTASIALVLGVIALWLDTYPFVHADTTNAIVLAKAQGQVASVTEKKGRELGLVCITQPEMCAMLIMRAENNQQLKEAFLKAKAAHVGVLPGKMLFAAGEVGPEYAVVNINASDEAIIAFLTE